MDQQLKDIARLHDKVRQLELDLFNERMRALVKPAMDRAQIELEMLERLRQRRQNAIKELGGHDRLWHPKYRGHMVETVLNFDPAYLVWMHESGHINLRLSIYREAQKRCRNR